MRAFGTICLFLALSGCSKFLEKFNRLGPAAETEVRFANEARGLAALAALNGKLMVYAIGAEPGSPRKTFRFDSEEVANGTPGVPVPNGPTRFYFVGFSGGGMTTDVRCGIANGGMPYNLSGQPMTVQVVMSRANCDHPDFRSNTNQVAAGTGFEALELVSCQGGTSITGFTDTSACTTPKGDINHVNSVRIQLLGYETRQGDPPDAESVRPWIESDCIRGSGKPGFNAAFTQAPNAASAVVALSNTTILFGLTSGIFRSSNGGTTFASVDATDTNDLDGSGSAVVAATNGSGLMYSTDSGATWATSNVSTGIFYDVFAYSSTEFYAANGSNTLYKSTDGGATWATLSAIVGATGLKAAFFDGTNLYAGGYNSTNARLFQSIDGGSSWSAIFSPTGQTTVSFVKKIGSYLYWGSGSALYRSASANGSTPDSFCSAGCTTTGVLPGTAVHDAFLNDGTLYVATDSGIGVNPGHTPLTAGSWDNYATTELGGSYINVKRLAFANGKLWYATIASVSDAARVSDSRGSGAAFMGGSAIHVPTGGSPALPLATRIVVYNDPSCTSARRAFLFPRGIGADLALPVGEAVMRSGASAANRLFLRDF